MLVALTHRCSVPHDRTVRRVTEIEAQRLEDTREEREEFRKMLKTEVERQAQEKRLDIKLDK